MGVGILHKDRAKLKLIFLQFSIMLFISVRWKLLKPIGVDINSQRADQGEETRFKYIEVFKGFMTSSVIFFQTCNEQNVFFLILTKGYNNIKIADLFEYYYYFNLSFSYSKLILRGFFLTFMPGKCNFLNHRIVMFN